MQKLEHTPGGTAGLLFLLPVPEVPSADLCIGSANVYHTNGIIFACVDLGGYG